MSTGGTAISTSSTDVFDYHKQQFGIAVVAKLRKCGFTVVPRATEGNKGREGDGV